MNASRSLIESLKKRMLPEGGSAFFPGGGYRTDATAWAIIGLKSTGEGQGLIQPGLDRLAKEQSPDGRVVASPEAPDAFWVTSLAVLAWHGSDPHRENMNRAADFLTNTSGRHRSRQASDPVDHDPSIRGWPWTADAHSWVAPTSYGLLALRVAGKARHPGAEEAARMLMNRQLAKGGWNYGNTAVYGRQLYPQPDQTGIALTALKPYASREEVVRSLGYLQEAIGRISTPLSLGWGFLGLEAWGNRAPEVARRVKECADRQQRRGAYNTQDLSILLVATSRGSGLMETLAQRDAP